MRIDLHSEDVKDISIDDTNARHADADDVARGCAHEEGELIRSAVVYCNGWSMKFETEDDLMRFGKAIINRFGWRAMKEDS